MTIQKKAIEQYLLVLFMLYKVVLVLSVWIKSRSVTMQMNAIEQYNAGFFDLKLLQASTIASMQLSKKTLLPILAPFKVFLIA